MNQNKSVIDVRDNHDERIGSHELGVDIKRLPIVRFQQLKVTDKMYYQKEDEEKTGEGHDYFSPDRTGEKIRKPIHSLY